MSIQKLHYENLGGMLIRREGLLNWRCPLCKAEGQSPEVMRACPECGSKEATLPGAQPAPSFADAYQGAMEEVAIWKKRALEAEELNRKFIAEINGPTYMGEPAQPAPSLASSDVSLISEGKTQPAQSVKDAIIDDLQSQFNTEGITEHDSGDALIRLSDAIAAVEDNFAQPAPSVPEDVIEQAVTRFLSWKLPKDFHPDGGMVFIPTKGRGYDSPHWPCGTNLLNAQQAREMLRHVLAAAPEAKK